MPDTPETSSTATILSDGTEEPCAVGSGGVEEEEPDSDDEGEGDGGLEEGLGDVIGDGGNGLDGGNGNGEAMGDGGNGGSGGATAGKKKGKPRASMPTWLTEHYERFKVRVDKEMEKDPDGYPACYRRADFWDRAPSPWISMHKKP